VRVAWFNSTGAFDAALPLANKKPPGFRSTGGIGEQRAGARRQVRRRPKAFFSIVVNIGSRRPKVKILTFAKGHS
jgi:hypothetical protein